MPAAIPIIVAAISAAGLGEGIYSQLNKPSAPKPLTPAQIANQNQLNPAQLANAVRNAKGDVQAQTSGGASPDYLAQLIQSQYGSAAGNPGIVGQQANNQWSGTPSFGSSASGGGSFGSGSTGTTGVGGGLPFGNASSGGLGSTGLATPPGSSGFNISDWLQQLQQGQGA